MVTACPVCMANLDMRASESLRLPVFYFTELMGLALGHPDVKKWLAGHLVDPLPLLEKIGFGF